MTSPCAMATRDSPFLTSKDTSTITMPREIAQHHQWPASRFKRVCQRARSPIRRRRNRWKNLRRRGDATDRDHRLVNGKTKSAVMPAVGTVPGPDVIVGDLIGLVQLDSGAVNRVGISLGTDACNKGTENVEWLALPDNRHPFIPQNLYRMSGGANNTEQFEQIGQSWGKHAFAAASSNTCGFGCNGVGGDHLGSGCSDAYGAGLNGAQDLIGSRAWVNPFTGFFAQNPDPNNHSGHVHAPADPTAHRILVDVNDLIPALNRGDLFCRSGIHRPARRHLVPESSGPVQHV